VRRLEALRLRSNIEFLRRARPRNDCWVKAGAADQPGPSVTSPHYNHDAICMCLDLLFAQVLNRKSPRQHRMKLPISWEYGLRR
jgi:hypothetical protein